MTIGNSLYIGVSGLIAHGEAMSTVGDNIANVSTIGFKRSRASFNDLLGAQTNQAGNGRVGGGTYLGANQQMWQQGQITQTNNPLDVAINGDGMFVLSGKHGGSEGQYLSRDGRFSLSNDGKLVNQQGMRVQGYTVTNGVPGGLGDINLQRTQSPAIATTSAKINVQLDSDDIVAPGTPFDPANDASFSYQSSVKVYDSIGKAHTVNMYYRNLGGGNVEYHAMVDGSELTGGTTGTPTQIASGTMTFDTNGRLTSETVTTSSANFTNATPGQSIAFTFGNAGGEGSSLYSGDSVSEAVDIDGRAYGNLKDIKIQPNGSIEGTFDNGDTFEVARLALADVQNYEGLARQGDGLYTATNASGQLLIDEAAKGARGGVMGGALEQSNVDLSTELVTLIAYQRAFQANSKTVTTADEMLNEIVNIKR